jgi:hypothetical protein
MDHYIVTIASGHGSQFAHIEVPKGANVPISGVILAVDAGPFDTAEEAWAAWHQKQGNLK